MLPTNRSTARFAATADGPQGVGSTIGRQGGKAANVLRVVKKSGRIVGRAVLGAVILVSALGIVGGRPVSAKASGTSVMVQTETLHSAASTGSFGVWSAYSGKPVAMECWTHGQNYDGGAKWFYVDTLYYPYASGFVPANSVGQQTIVGLC